MIKNKKGFTLVELLGAIVILGIISTIAIVSLTKVLESSHKKYYDTQVKLLQTAGQTYFSDHKDLLPTINFGVNRVNLGVLIDQGYINEIVDYNKKECYTDERSYVTVTRRGPSSYVYQAVLSCKDRSTQTQDNNNEKGNFNISLDYSNGIDSSNGFKEGNIYYVRGTLSLGLTITTNSSGDNAGITGYRYSIVKKSNGKIYKTSEVIPSKDSICTSSGDNCTTLSDTINIRAKDIKDGEYTLEIEAFNLKGNSNNKQFATYTIVIDKTKPKCNIDITDGDKGNFIDNNQWYKDGKKKKVTLKMTIKEKNKAKSRLETTEFTDSFLSVSYKNTNDEMTKYQTTNTSSEGQVWYGQVEDKAGNSVKCTKKVFFDMTAPTCTITKKTSNGTIINGNSWTNSDYTATRSCSDDSSKCDSKSLSSWSEKISAEVGKVNNDDIVSDNDSVYDNAGNKGSCGTITAMIDKENPSCSVKIEGTKGNFQPAGNFYGNTAVQFYKKGDSPIAKLTKGDGYGSGLVTYGISKNNSELDNKKDSLPLNDGDNDWSINGYARDKVGNESYCDTKNSGDKIPYYFIDLKEPSPPTLTKYKTNSDYVSNGEIYSSGWYKGYVSVVASGSTDNSGSLDNYYMTSIGQVSNASNEAGSTRNVAKQGGGVYVSFKACDKAGNCSTDVSSGEIKLDRNNPVIYVDGVSGGMYGNYKREVKCKRDDTYSDIKSFVGDFTPDNVWNPSNSGERFIDASVNADNTVITLKHKYLSSGFKNTQYRCCDAVGNCVEKSVSSPANNHEICCRCYNSSNSMVHKAADNPEWNCSNQHNVKEGNNIIYYNSPNGPKLHNACSPC